MKLCLHPEHEISWSVPSVGVYLTRSSKGWRLHRLSSATPAVEQALGASGLGVALFPSRREALQTLGLALGLAPAEIELKRAGYRSAGFWRTTDGRFAITNHFAYWAGEAGTKTASWRVTPPEPEWDEPAESYPQTSAWLKLHGLQSTEFPTRSAAVGALEAALQADPPLFAAGA